MNAFTYEPALRLSAFLGVLFLMALWEFLTPRRPLIAAKPARWLSNLGLAALNTLATRVVLPAAAVGVAVFAEEHGWGLFHYVELPAWLAFALSMIVLDLVVYVQHVAFHRVPWLWRLHLVHHADLDFDVTTGTRFHTLEILVSLGIKAAAVLLLGAPPLAVLLFEMVLNATSMFSHGNVRIPARLDRWLRLLVVTPEMHRVHHSVDSAETNRNFGFNLPWWDRLFGTYKAQPDLGHEAMTIGLKQLRDEQAVERLHRMLWLPFVPGVHRVPPDTKVE